MAEDNILDGEDLEVVHHADGSMEFLEPAEPEDVIAENLDHYENLALYMDEDELAEIADQIIEGFEQDESSRHGHINQIKEGIEQLGLDDDNVQTPFEGACTAFHPLLIENGVKLQAKAAAELLPANGPVKVQIIGQPNEELEQQALRVKTHMNWQLMHQIPEYYSNSEKAFFQAAIFGDAFKKQYPDSVAGRIKDCIIGVDRLVVNNASASIENATRVTEIMHLSERDFKAFQYGGLYRSDVECEAHKIQKTEIEECVDRLLGLSTEYDKGFTVLEQHVYLDLPGFEDEIPLPYIVHVNKADSTVLGIYRNWEENGNKFEKQEWYSHYGFVPAFGFYHLGYIHLLGNFQKTLTAVLRSLVDAGQFANLQGGFKLKNMRILDDDGPHAPGEFKDVENYGNDISKSISYLNFKEPSGTLFQLLQFIEARGQKFADSTEQVIADSTNYGPVGTTMALLDASTKFFSAVHKRFHNAQKKEFEIIARLNQDLLYAEDTEINIPGGQINVRPEDYDGRVDIIPVSDPNISSSAHRMTLANTKLQAAQLKPDIHNMREIYKEFYNAMGVEDVSKILPEPQEAQPSSPMEDIAKASQGLPIKAFPDQDHDAHISIKTSFLEDPVIGQNPNMQIAVPAIQANIREHLVMKFAAQTEGAMSLGFDEQKAAQEVQRLNEFKKENPLGELDPKQLLAQAELMRANNEALRLKLKAREDEMDTALEMAGLHVDVRKQNLDLLINSIKFENDKEMLRFKEAVAFVKESLNKRTEEPQTKDIDTQQTE